MVTLVIPPKRNPVRSPAKDRLRLTISTPSASIPTNSSPIAASWFSRARRPTSEIPPTITAALANAPMVGLNPTIVAMARPGSTPWASASPMKVIPRSTTHVPTSPQAMAARVPASRARCMVTESRNGSITHPDGDSANSSVEFNSAVDTGAAGTDRPYFPAIRSPLVRIISR